MNPAARILVADDETLMRRSIRLCLESGGFRVLEAVDGDEALELNEREKPDMVILDLRMPRVDGLAAAAQLRRTHTDLPILMLTSQSEVSDRVSGLDAGADDYLAKPFDRRELLARVKALLRRGIQSAPAPVLLRFGEVEVNLEARTANRGAEEIALTKTEFLLLELLAKNRGSPVSRNQMLDSVWGYTYLPSSRTVDTHIWRLRKKIGDVGDEPKWIRNVHGQGYVLTGIAEPVHALSSGTAAV
jgi:two-component system, OmpR family, response regulator MprA